jgi:DNA end-binding protein Ku
MMAYTLQYPNELRNRSDYFRDIKDQQIDDDSLELAEALMAKRSSPFDVSSAACCEELQLRNRGSTFSH